MRNRFNFPIYIIGFLVLLGVFFQLRTNPGAIFIPIVVFGSIYLLWRYPPQTWKKNNVSSSRTKKSRTDLKRKRQRAKFRVIEGNKGRNSDYNDQDDLPKYH